MEKLLKAIYDWLPFDGKKTYLSAIIAILGVIKIMWPDQPLIDTILTWLNSLSGEEILALGGIGMAAGLHHKRLKG